jgi:uncharacterized protein (TIGR03435 family)
LCAGSNRAFSPAFEVAVIKLADPSRQGKGVRVNGQTFNAFNYTLKDLIKYAYNVHATQIISGPNWMDSDKFDITAKILDAKPVTDRLRLMAAALMQDRFELMIHRERKEIDVWSLVVGKGGPKLRERHAGDGGPAAFNIALPNAPRIPGRNASMERLAAVLQVAVLDRPVVDQTGLTGIYDFDLKWLPDEFQFDGQGGKGMWRGDPNDPDIFSAIEQQLGLRLESRKIAMEVLVIDHAEKPGQN